MVGTGKSQSTMASSGVWDVANKHLPTQVGIGVSEKSTSSFKPVRHQPINVA